MRRTIALWACAGLTAAAAVSGCGGGAGAAKPTVLNVSTVAPPDTFNPFAFGSEGLAHVYSAIYTPLVQTDDKNAIVGGVARSWTLSKDGKTYTFKLRSGMRWSDGKPLTSADVLWTFKTYLNADASIWVGIIGGVDRVSAPDAATFVVRLSSPNAAWLAQVAGRQLPILPAHLLKGVPVAKLKDDPYFHRPTVGSGPYTFVRYQPGQFIEYKANPSWWGGTASFPKLFMKILDPNVAVGQLGTGEVQLVSPVAPQDAQQLKQDGKVMVTSRTGVAPDAIHLNNDSPLLKDARVRRALILALDRNKICQTVLQGYCAPEKDNVWLISPKWALPAEGDIDPLDYDPAEAKALLRQAGWKPGATLRMLLIQGNPAYWKQALTVVQAQWKAVGVDMTIRAVAPARIPDLFNKQRSMWDAFYAGGADFSLDPDQVAPYATCATAFPKGANSSHFCNKHLDALWARGRETVGDAARAPIYHEAFALMNKDPSSITMYWPNVTAAYRSQLRNVRFPANTGQTFWNIGKWTWAG
ncbi:MAG: peptide/nickel transport system substrate-binding protein [Solirubrobacteraceae bacterium]